MSKGIVVLAQNNKQTNYVLQACLLALSLKATNSDTKISIITNNRIPDQYKFLFDKVIKIPWGDSAKSSSWKVENRWKIYHVTPYDETLVFDTDMLVLKDISHWWNFLSKYNLFFVSNVKTYRNETVTSNYYRKTFVENNLPNIYTGIFYFKKSDFAHQFFKWLEIITYNWQLFYSKFTPIQYNNWYSLDLSSAIAIKILDIENYVTDNSSFITFTHMKPMIQNWSKSCDRWQDEVDVFFTEDCTLKISNYLQTEIFHYTEKDFVTDEIIESYRKYLNV